ncbi:MAG: NAD(P)-binding domain-containing protein, partial [Gemmatimonadales bacterium]
MKVGILGTGQVGQSLARGFEKYGHEVRLGSRDPARPYADAAR